jgi:AcrR family transcriptional regulator
VTRDRAILDAAAELFYERGFGAASVDDIGAKAGVTGAAIYRHFRGKEEILSVLFEEGMDEVLRVTGGRFEDPVEELLHLAREHARHVQTHPRLASVWIREGRALAGPYRHRYQRRARQYIGRWRECVARCFPGATGAEVSSSVHLSLGMLNSMPSWSSDAKGGEQVPDLLARIVVAGLGTLES